MEYFIILAIIVLDQLTKMLALWYLQPIDTLALWKGVFHFSYRTNTGAAFSIFSEHTSSLAILSFVISGILLWYLYRLKKKEAWNLSHLAFAMIIGGALGNGIDRLRLGHVIDFFDFRLINFAVFNVADSFVVLGVILMGIDLLFLEPRRRKGEKDEMESVDPGN